MWIGATVYRSVRVPGISAIRSTSYFAPDRSENRIDPVRSHVNSTLYLVRFWIDLLPDRSRGIGVINSLVLLMPDYRLWKLVSFIFLLHVMPSWLFLAKCSQRTDSAKARSHSMLRQVFYPSCMKILAPVRYKKHVFWKKPRVRDKISLTGHCADLAWFPHIAPLQGK